MNINFKEEKLDIFKGVAANGGRINKIRSVGYALVDSNREKNRIFLKGSLFKGYMSLIAEKDPSKNHDFIIGYSPSGANGGLDLVAGVGHLMTGKNSGLIHLLWDLLGENNLYLNLAHSNFCNENICKIAA